MSIKNICVYCASSSDIDKIYFDSAEKLGELFSSNNIKCICGAGNSGLMGKLTDSMLNNGGKVIGVIPKFMVDGAMHHTKLNDLIITETMHERKAKMAELADAFIALPGGCGTMEELMEIITWKQLNLFNKPIIIYNINNYYDHLIKMLDHAISQTFMSKENASLWEVANSVEDIYNIINKES